MKLFDTVKQAKVKRTAFNKSHSVKMSGRTGNLYPVLVEEVVPGDTYKKTTEAMVRTAPLKFPLQHAYNIYFHDFFVPNRLVWEDFDKFITDDLNTFVPNIDFSSTGVEEGSLADYMGLPIGNGNQYIDVPVNALPFKAYQLIYNEYYRDQNLIPEVSLDHKDPAAINTLRKRSWEKDYFTSALPFTQKGSNTSVLPVDSTVNYLQTARAYQNAGLNASDITAGAAGDAKRDLEVDAINILSGPVSIENIASVRGGIDINEFRLAHRLQRYYETLARAGSRYREFLLSMFGVKNDDLRIMVPEYLGGGVTPIVFSEVLNHSDNADNASPQGSMTGHGISVGRTNNVNAMFKEHGYMITIMSVLPRAEYASQGLHKHWTRQDNLDFYNPHFANLGEQAVLNRELLLTQDQQYNTDTFGYQSRYAEMKYSCGRVAGAYRTSLSQHHAARIFDEFAEIQDLPNLNKEFIEADTTEIDQRIFPDPSTDYLWIQLYHNITAIRPMPYYGTPTL